MGLANDCGRGAAFPGDALPTSGSSAARFSAATWEAGLVKPLPIVLRQRWVAPTRYRSGMGKSWTGLPGPSLLTASLDLSPIFPEGDVFIILAPAVGGRSRCGRAEALDNGWLIPGRGEEQVKTGATLLDRHRPCRQSLPRVIESHFLP